MKNLFISNTSTNSEESSILSDKIKYIIDGFCARIRKPTYNQSLFYRGGDNISYHLLNNHILNDFDSIIRAFVNSIPGSFQDGEARHLTSIRNIIAPN